jgi:hypothetical protein
METAWHTANFWAAAHSKKGLQPLAHYLTDKKPRGGGNARAAAFFRRMAKRQDPSTGSG